MKILVVDGQGGGIGKAVIEELIKNFDNIDIIATGTNAIATSSMLKAGANIGATGENPIVYNSNNVDVIVGPIGICFGNSLYGEVSPKMAEAISLSNATKVLIPISKCKACVVGVTNKALSDYVDDVIETIKKL